VPTACRARKKGVASPDETYVIDLCDSVLGMKAERQKTFSFLLSDPNKLGRRRHLPVDGYYEELRLVVEYHEREHSEPSGLRQEVPRRHSIELIVFTYQDFKHDSARRLIHTDENQETVIRKLIRR
jgi:hypothetical protein